MNKKSILTMALAATGLLATSCQPKADSVATVSDKVITTNYVGTGVEWDPYDEAEAWGAAKISEEDWAKLFKRLDFMRLSYVRCMINSPYRYYNKEKDSFDKEMNLTNIKRVLQYCQDNNITVLYGEYNPPTWEMKADQRWVEASVDYLNFLVGDLGFTCIKQFTIFNEPDGNWASTNGDYKLWLEMLHRFDKEVKKYPALAHIKFAGPDVVLTYKNDASPYDSEGWVAQTAKDANDLIGFYDVHAYPGQHQVRYGNFEEVLANHKRHVPAGKDILLGEAGYKYWREPDSLLMKEYNRRVEGHPYTKGSDCNMLVYDYFYGLDMSLLAMKVMNGGYVGVAAWMLDDAMHSQWDSGKTEDVKIWGMWNTLGEEVFNDPKQEELRPWFYTWSLMSRFFPGGSQILDVQQAADQPDIYLSAGQKDGDMTLTMVNFGDEDRVIEVALPAAFKDAAMYMYQEDNSKVDADGFPVPVQTGISGDKLHVTIPAQSFVLYTDMK